MYELVQKLIVAGYKILVMDIFIFNYITKCSLSNLIWWENLKKEISWESKT
jgi:hypothetical protein